MGRKGHWGAWAGIVRKTNFYVALGNRAERERGHLFPGLMRDIETRWAREMLENLAVEVAEVKGTPMEQPGLWLGNHISYVDIPLLMSRAQISFVSKEEVGKWPVFGKGLKRADTVFVKRESSNSRRAAAETIARAVTKEKRKIALFPSGTTSIDETKPWRHGAFKIAHHYDLWVQPFRLSYTPLRLVAYINEDSFVPHLHQLLKSRKATATLEFHKPVKITDPAQDALTWQRWAQQALDQ